MAFGIRKFAVRVQRREASSRQPARASLVQQRRIGQGVKAPKSAKSSKERLKGLLKGSKLKKGVKR